MNPPVHKLYMRELDRREPAGGYPKPFCYNSKLLFEKMLRRLRVPFQSTIDMLACVFYVKGFRPLPREVLQCGRPLAIDHYMQMHSQAAK